MAPESEQPPDAQPGSTARFDRLVAAVMAGLLIVIAAIVGFSSWLNAADQGARILYLAWDAANVQQLYSVDLVSSDITQLTEGEAPIASFATAPDGERVVYAVANSNRDQDLWLWSRNGRSSRLLLDCENALCTNPVWTPDGARIIYERVTVFGESATPAPPRLWWLDVASGQTLQVFQDSQTLGNSPRLSPNGEWLAYVVPLEQQLQLYHFPTAEGITLPSSTGEAVTWLDDQRLIFTDINIRGETFAVHGYLFETTAAERAQNLSGEEANVSDAGFRVSPNREQLAFIRKAARTASGHQLWVMNVAGGNGRSLTSDPSIQHGPPVWNRDGTQLAFQRFDTQEPFAQPAIWLIDPATGEQRELVEIGFGPQWLEE